MRRISSSPTRAFLAIAGDKRDGVLFVEKLQHGLDLVLADLQVLSDAREVVAAGRAEPLAPAAVGGQAVLGCARCVSREAGAGASGGGVASDTTGGLPPAGGKAARAAETSATELAEVPRILGLWSWLRFRGGRGRKNSAAVRKSVSR